MAIYGRAELIKNMTITAGRALCVTSQRTYFKHTFMANNNRKEMEILPFLAMQEENKIRHYFTGHIIAK